MNEPTTQLVAVNGADFGLPEAETQHVAAVFVPIIEQMTGIEPAFHQLAEAAEEGITPELSAEARRLRLQYVKIRTATAAAHKAAKAYHLAGGRYVDAWKNAQGQVSAAREDRLFAIEEHAERIERARVEALAKERYGQIAPFVDGVPTGLGEMDDATFSALLAGAKVQHAERLRAAAQAEAERVEAERRDREERARIAAENERLRAEVEAERRKVEQLKADQLAADIERRRAQPPQVDEPLLFGDGATVLVSEITERQAGRRDVVEWMRGHGLVKAAAAAETHFNLA